MTTRFVIMEMGVDYDDERYSIGGDGAKVLKNSYETVEEAKKELKNQLRKRLSGFDLHDFNEDGSHLVREYLKEKYDDEWHWGAKWEEFISWCDEANLNWYTEAPQLLQVFEIEV